MLVSQLKLGALFECAPALQGEARVVECHESEG